MPELPEVQTIANELKRKVMGKKINKVEVKAEKLVSVGSSVLSPIRKTKPGTAKEFIKIVNGQKITGVSRRAKILILDLKDPFSILVHFKMTGQFIFEDKKLFKKTKGYYRIFNNSAAPKVLLPCKHTHVIFYFEGGSKLYFNDVRKFGYLKLVKDEDLSQIKEFKEYGPEPLSKEFTLPRFILIMEKWKKRKINAKQLLMDSKFIAGIGNIYSDEILFHSKVMPTRLVSKITNKEYKNIYQNIIKVLKKAIAAKGSSVGDFIRTDGQFGTMGKYHFVYGRAGEKCKVCDTTIKSIKIGGRTGSFCPHCQK
jgi:formamidopyrimidine-DNA glycosylase